MSKSRQYAIRIDAEMPMTKDAEAQQRKFQNLARELECDTDEAAFKAKLVKVAKAQRADTPRKKA
jgi:hypothetical protein